MTISTPNVHVEELDLRDLRAALAEYEEHHESHGDLTAFRMRTLDNIVDRSRELLVLLDRQLAGRPTIPTQPQEA